MLRNVIIIENLTLINKLYNLFINHMNNDYFSCVNIITDYNNIIIIDSNLIHQYTFAHNNHLIVIIDTSNDIDKIMSIKRFLKSYPYNYHYYCVFGNSNISCIPYIYIYNIYILPLSIKYVVYIGNNINFAYNMKLKYINYKDILLMPDVDINSFTQTYHIVNPLKYIIRDNALDLSAFDNKCPIVIISGLSLCYYGDFCNYIMSIGYNIIDDDNHNLIVYNNDVTINIITINLSYHLLYHLYLCYCLEYNKPINLSVLSYGNKQQLDKLLCYKKNVIEINDDNFPFQLIKNKYLHMIF